MKQRLALLFLLYSFANFLHAQEAASRILSYSELFTEMASAKEVYRLVNATIKYNASTDQRFLETDSLQRARFDTLRINCKVYLDEVVFQNTPDDLDIETGKYLREISLQKILFGDSVVFTGSKIELRSLQQCTFLSFLDFTSCKFPNGFIIENSIGKAGLTFSSSKFQGSLEIKQSQFYGTLKFIMIDLPSYLHLQRCLLHECEIYWTGIDRIILQKNTIKSNIDLVSNTINSLEVNKNIFSNVAADSSQYYGTLFKLEYNNIAGFSWHANAYQMSNRYAACLSMKDNTYTKKFILTNTIFPNPIVFRRNNISGSFRFGQACSFAQGIYYHETYFNERSTINWPSLKSKIFLSDYMGIRQFPEDMDSLLSYGLLERELENAEYCEALIKSKRMFYNVFRSQGLGKNANEVLIEIKDLETAIWKNEYLSHKTVKAYFNWKMNVFLKKFSAYGTDPVIAIIYALKVILLFGLFYLFFHNDWDIGGRKKIGKRLRFILTYFKVNKGLSELDEEQQLKNQDEVALLRSENEESKGKIPAFFTATIRWYVQSNLISYRLRKVALRKMDVLRGTFSKLPQKQKQKVAFISSLWFVGFLVYTLLLKALNALTLSLNAFTTLGFGNIPTKGFSRYIVIVQGFIGWVLMTIFSVTLITQLLQ